MLAFYNTLRGGFQSIAGRKVTEICERMYLEEYVQQVNIKKCVHAARLEKSYFGPIKRY